MPELGETKVVRVKEPYYQVLKYIWYGCVDCGRTKWVRLVNEKPQSLRCHSCAQKLVRQKAQEKFATTNWEGAKHGGGGGGILVKVFPRNFFYPMATKHGYIQEHRLVMAKHLKRCLLPWEVVHHKNGIRDDNRIENLELITDKRFHLVDTAVKSQMRHLNKRIEKLEIQVKLLQWRLNEREKTNVQEVL